MASVEWGEYRLKKLFEICSSKKIFHANYIDEIYENKEVGAYPYVVRMTKNNGIRGYIKENEIYLNDANTLSFAQDTFTVYYQKEKYFTGNKVKILKPKFNNPTENRMQFIASSFYKALKSLTWGIGSDVEMINNIVISLPVKNNEIDFDFMESFVAELEAQRVAELEAYLIASGLDDYELTRNEKEVLEEFRSGNICFSEFEFVEVFENIKQGRRLKKDDQIPGTIPFVMSGISNNGVVGYISNPVASFPKNSITIDIFGNTFYRNYDYGAGDDTGVYWTVRQYDKEVMLFFTAAMAKAVHNKFSYGKKLRSSQSLHFKMLLPSINNAPDYEKMKTLIISIQKLVIKDVVDYADNKIKKTKQVVNYK